MNHKLIYKDKNLSLYLEEYHKDGWGVFIHCTVTNWSKDIFREFQAVWDSVLDDLLIQGYESIGACILLDDIKLYRFASLFGFQSTGTRVLDNKGQEREIFKCLT